MKKHAVKLTNQEKQDWFVKQVEERQRVNPLRSEEELVEFVQFCRKTFKELYGRGVSGSFFRLVLAELGVVREQSEAYKRKKEFIFKLLDENQAFRDSKVQLRKYVEAHYGERIHGIVFDEILREYREEPEKVKPQKNVDIYGQLPLFEE